MRINHKLKQLEKKYNYRFTLSGCSICILHTIFTLMLLLQIKYSQAQLSPGALHQVHAQLEGIKNCTLCHGVGQKISANNCLKCHEAIRNRITEKQGLHANPEFATCENCHVEHQGRNFELIWWEKGLENFDHSKTGFFLQGKHTELKCLQCHQVKFIKDKETLSKQSVNLERTFLGLQKDCLSCHHDEHRGELGKKCLDCHQFTGWKPAALFDHTRTAFPLTGRHLQIACSKCHTLQVDNRFPDDRDYLKFRVLSFHNCDNCHQDVHQNKFGKECTSCHNTDGWKNYDRTKFDHEKTRYPLRGKHRLLACEKCHHPGRPRTAINFQHCQDCHSDYHQGQFQHRPDRGACESCHDVNSFSPAKFTIEQHNQSGFILEGSHLAVPCAACHTRINAGQPAETIRFKFSGTQCVDCHQDPHSGSAAKYFQLQNCSNCHSTQDWTKVQFDHSQTAFPLETGHSRVRCTACHVGKTAGKVIITSLSPYCQDCHNDPHHGQFERVLIEGKAIIPCQRCHSAKSWTPDKFDHNQHSNFKLEGAHLKLACKQCHSVVSENNQKYIRYKPIPHSCADCHGSKKNARE